MTSLKRAGLLLTLCLLPLLMAGCLRSNTIKLTYATVETPIECPGKAVVYRFEDLRKDREQLGLHENGSAIVTTSDIGDWVGWAIFDELMAAGCDTKYRTITVADDIPVITGEILDVSLDQTGSTTFRGKVALNLRIRKSGRDVHVEKFISEVEDIVLPGYGSQSDLMAAALQGVITTALPVICENL